MEDRYRILVISKEELLLQKVKELKGQDLPHIDVITKGMEAFDRIKSEKYHIILLDLDIPDTDGMELLRKIKGYDCLAQIITMTSHSTMEKIFSSLEYGANDYLVIPTVNQEEFLDRIKASMMKLERWRQFILQLVK